MSPGGWGILAANDTIGAASGLSLGSGSVKLCDRDGNMLKAYGEDEGASVGVVNAGTAIQGGSRGKIVGLEWTAGDWSVCGCGEFEFPPPGGVFCKACGGVTIDGVTIVDDLGTFEMFRFNGTNATFAGTDIETIAGHATLWFPNPETIWITPVHTFDTDMKAPPPHTDEPSPCYGKGHLYYAYGLSCNLDGTIRLTLYLPQYIVCDGMDTPFPRVGPWYYLFDEDGNYPFSYIERNLPPICGSAYGYGYGEGYGDGLGYNGYDGGYGAYDDPEEIRVSTDYETPEVDGVDHFAEMFTNSATATLHIRIDTAPPTEIPCGVCNLPTTILYVSWTDDFGGVSVPMTFDLITEKWTSDCHGNQKFILECYTVIDNRPRLTVLTYSGFNCPDGTPTTCLIYPNEFTSHCTPFFLDFQLGDFDCPEIPVRNYHVTS